MTEPPAFDHSAPVIPIQRYILSTLAAVFFIALIVSNVMIMQRIALLQGDQARIFAMLAELQVDSRPPPTPDTPSVPGENIGPEAPGPDSPEPPLEERRENELYRQLEARLERNFPKAQINSEVKLRQQNGLILRGTFLGIKDDAVLLLQNDQIIDITSSALDRESRLSTDSAFRDKVIRMQIKKTELLQGKRQEAGGFNRE